MKKTASIIKKIIVIILPFIIFGIVYFYQNEIDKLTTILPACPIHKYLGVLCPGCGNTRSVRHLLKGDVLNSLKFNITPIFLLLIGILVYVEFTFYVFGKRLKIVPRNRIIWIFTAIVFLLYFVIRNFIPLF